MNTEDAFHIHARLGSGSTGVVFRGTREEDGKQCALKALHPDFVQVIDMDHVRAVTDAIARVRHHALPRFVRLMEVRGEPVIVRPFIRGVDLGTIIAGSSAPLRPALQIAAEIAGVVDSVQHQTGFAHGDIKPSNVFIDAAAEIRVVDFGMALSKPGMIERTLTLLHGSVGFMSPERADKQTSHATDAYSLALLLSWLITGRTPPRTSANPERQRQQRDALLRGLAEHDAPKDLIELIERCLAYDPTTRPPMAELGRSLAILATKAPGPDVKTWAGPLVEAIVARSTEIPIVDDGKPLSTAGPAPPRTISQVPTPTSIDTSAAPRDKKRTMVFAGIALVVATVMLAAAFVLGSG